MGDKDIISKQIFKTLVRDFATYLFGLPVSEVELLDEAEVELLDTSQQRVEERRSDLIAKVTLVGGESFILHIEIQNDNQANMPVRMLRYLTDIMLDHPKIPVRQYLVYIGKRPLTMPDGLDLPRLSYRYELLDMRQVDSEVLLRQDSPDAWVLAVLGTFRDQTPREFLVGILDRLVRELRDSPDRLREYVYMLEILASNREFGVDIEEELEMLTIEYEKLPTYRMGVKKGHQEEKQEIAKKLIQMGLESVQVAAATGLSVADVEQLRVGQAQ